MSGLWTKYRLSSHRYSEDKLADTTVHAIVLRRRDAGESDRRLTLLTEELGKIDVVAKGARKGGSRLAGISDPLSCSVLFLSLTRKVRFVTQAQPLSSFSRIRTDYDKLCYGLALSELYGAVLPYEEESSEPFRLFFDSLRAIEAHEKPIVAFLWAQLLLLDLSGFMPQWGQCCVSECEVKEAEPWLSPHAGGYVCADCADRFTDRFQSRAEVLYGLSRLANLEQPPSNLKFAHESLLALMPFWRQIVECPLPACDQALSMSIEQVKSE